MAADVHTGIAKNLDPRRSACGITEKANMAAHARAAVGNQRRAASASGLVKNHEAATCAADRAGMKCEGPVTCRRAVAKNDLGRVGVIGCGAIHDKLATACARVPVKTNETGAGKAECDWKHWGWRKRVVSSSSCW